MPYRDSEEQKQYQAARYQRNREADRDRLRDRRKARAKWFWLLKEKLKCERCGETDPVCLEFHHKDSERRNGNEKQMVSHMVSYAYSEKHILEEIAKCHVVCANCHRRIHYTAEYRRYKSDTDTQHDN